MSVYCVAPNVDIILQSGWFWATSVWDMAIWNFQNGRQLSSWTWSNPGCLHLLKILEISWNLIGPTGNFCVRRRRSTALVSSHKNMDKYSLQKYKIYRHQMCFFKFQMHQNPFLVSQTPVISSSRFLFSWGELKYPCPGCFLKSLLESPGNLLEICLIKFVDTMQPEIVPFDPPSPKNKIRLEPNMKGIGSTVAEIWPFEIFQSVWMGPEVGRQYSYFLHVHWCHMEWYSSFATLGTQSINRSQCLRSRASSRLNS